MDLGSFNIELKLKTGYSTLILIFWEYNSWLNIEYLFN